MQKYFSGHSLIVANESFQVPSKYQALLELLSELQNVKTLGFWNCNMSNSKLAEVLTIVRDGGSIVALELCEMQKELSKKALEAIAGLFS